MEGDGCAGGGEGEVAVGEEYRPAQQQAPAGPVHTAGLAWLEQHVWSVATLALSTQKCTLYFNILHTSFFL